MIEIYDEKDNVINIDGFADIYIDNNVNIRIFREEIEINYKSNGKWLSIKIKR